MKKLTYRLQCALFLLLINLAALISAFGQITPSQDAYTNTATATTNYGAATTLGVVSTATSIQTTYIKFDLSSLPAGYTSANVAKATLKLYVDTVKTAGSLNLDYVNGAWAEKTITADLVPALGNTIASGVSLSSANAHDYVLVDVTVAVGEWLNGSQANDGIALVANSGLSATFDSKENAGQSHPAELDIVLTSGGTITGVMTANGSGLTGGGNSGTLNLGLQSCSTNQVLRWNGSAWSCASVGTGTISGVVAGTDLTGGGTSGNVTLSLNTTTTDARYARLSAYNQYTNEQSVQPIAVSSGNGSQGLFVVGGNTTDASGQPGGFGMTATGGTNTAAGNGAAPGIGGIGGPVGVVGQQAGIGIMGQGGATALGGSGGTGVVATGSSATGSGSSAYFGGTGIQASGGAGTGKGMGGYGINATGGDGASSSNGGPGGTGGYFQGGNTWGTTAEGGSGIVVVPGHDANFTPAPAGIFQGEVWVQSSTGINIPQAYLEQTLPGDYSRLRFYVDNSPVGWDIASGGGTQPVLNFYRWDAGNVMSLTPGGSQYLSMGNGASLSTGGTWTNASDRNLKEDFLFVDGADLLKRLETVPMLNWKYKTETGIRHVGPMAQDFYQAFKLGSDDKHIATVDEGGVALAAIQELYRQGQKKDAKILELQSQVAGLSRQVLELTKARLSVTVLESRLARMEAQVRRAHKLHSATMNEMGKSASAKTSTAITRVDVPE